MCVHLLVLVVGTSSSTNNALMPTFISSSGSLSPSILNSWLLDRLPRSMHGLSAISMLGRRDVDQNEAACSKSAMNQKAIVANSGLRRRRGCERRRLGESCSSSLCETVVASQRSAFRLSLRYLYESASDISISRPYSTSIFF